MTLPRSLFSFAFFLCTVSLLFFTGCRAPDGVSLSWEQRMWTASDGKQMPFSVWEDPTVPLRAEVLAVHGLGGHDGDFRPLIEPLTAAGYRIVAVNLRGSGIEEAERDRGNLRSWTLWVEDLEAFSRLLAAREPELPRFLAGESLGSILAIHLAAREVVAWQGLVLFSPVVEIEGEVTFWQRQLFRLLRTFAPGFRIDPEDFVDPEEPRPEVTRDLEHRAYLAEAPHLPKSFTISYLAAIQQAIERVRPAWEKQPLPTLVFHAGEDIFIEADKVKAFFQGDTTPVGAPLVRVFYPEAYHLLLFDPVTPEVISALLDWLGD
jgi:alpha-beta hydrolase superfamily lysophospholipase